MTNTDDTAKDQDVRSRRAFDLEERTARFGEFRHKISVCKKEARETKHWLRMIATAEPDFKDDIRTLWQEAKELHLIFAAIWRRGERK